MIFNDPHALSMQTTFHFSIFQRRSQKLIVNENDGVAKGRRNLPEKTRQYFF
jgi:hypothetical protein